MVYEKISIDGVYCTIEHGRNHFVGVSEVRDANDALIERLKAERNVSRGLVPQPDCRTAEPAPPPPEPIIVRTIRALRQWFSDLERKTRPTDSQIS